jgi:hypothetical protein
MEVNMPNLVSLSGDGGIPEIELTIGNAQVGSFLFFLWDANETNPRRVPPGDETPPSFSLEDSVDSVNDLNQKFLTWQGIVGAPDTGSQLFSVRVRITQDGVQCAGSPIVNAGSFQDAKVVHNSLRFVVE